MFIERKAFNTDLSQKKLPIEKPHKETFPRIEKTDQPKQKADFAITGFIESISRNWNTVYLNSANKLKHFSKSSRELIELQMVVDHLNLQTSLLTKVAESAVQSVRKLQQGG